MIILLGLCLSLVVDTPNVAAQSCGYSPQEVREYSAPPADAPWPYFVVEFASGGREGYAAFVIDGPREKTVIRSYSSLDGIRWETQQRTTLNQPPDPLNGQDLPVVANSPWGDNFRIAYDNYSLRFSTDGGRHWADVGEAKVLMSVARIKGEHDALQSLAQKGVTPAGRDTTWRALIVSRIVFDPSHRGRIFLLTNKGIYRTEDYGQHWSLLRVGLEMLFEIQSLAIDPADPDRLLVGTTNGVYFSQNGGCQFERVFSDSHVPYP